VTVQFSNRSEISGGKAVTGDTVQDSKTSAGKREAPESTVFLVDILNPRLQVSPDHLHQVFSPYGAVLRIVGFQGQKGTGQFKALVEMAKVGEAAVAKRLLDGKDMFQG
jgi:hypothetical protein